MLTQLLPVQAGMFPIPVKQTVYTEGDGETGISNSLEWKYDVKFTRREQREAAAATVTAVERTLVVSS